MSYLHLRRVSFFNPFDTKINNNIIVKSDADDAISARLAVSGRNLMRLFTAHYDGTMILVSCLCDDGVHEFSLSGGIELHTRNF